MAIIGFVGIIAELYLLIIFPLMDKVPFEAKVYWAIAIPLFLGVSGVLAIVLWIGITMIQTPPPEAWDFDDLEDELEADDEDKTEKKEEDKEKPKEKGKTKNTAEPSTDEGIEGISGVTKTNAKIMIEAGFDSRAKLAAATTAELSTLKGIGKATAQKIIDNAK